MYNSEESKNRDIENAKVELTQAEAMKVLLKNNTLAAEIHISGLIMGTCDNKWLLPVVEKQIKEINKFLNGEKNSWN